MNRLILTHLHQVPPALIDNLTHHYEHVSIRHLSAKTTEVSFAKSFSINEKKTQSDKKSFFVLFISFLSRPLEHCYTWWLWAISKHAKDIA